MLREKFRYIENIETAAKHTSQKDLECRPFFIKERKNWRTERLR